MVGGPALLPGPTRMGILLRRKVHLRRKACVVASVAAELCVDNDRENPFDSEVIEDRAPVGP
jgi:hypothetical protein